MAALTTHEVTPRHLSRYCARSLEFSHVMTLSWKSEIMSVLNKAEDCQRSVVLLIGCEINHGVCFLALALDSENKIGHLPLSLGKTSKNKSYGNYARDMERGMGDAQEFPKHASNQKQLSETCP